MPTGRPHRVVVLALDGVLTFELGIPARIFGSATDKNGRALYEVVICSVDGGPIATESELTVQPASGPAAAYAHAQMSLRTFSRRFRGEVGMARSHPYEGELVCRTR